MSSHLYCQHKQYCHNKIVKTINRGKQTKFETNEGLFGQNKTKHTQAKV